MYVTVLNEFALVSFTMFRGFSKLSSKISPREKAIIFFHFYRLHFWREFMRWIVFFLRMGGKNLIRTV